MSIFSGDISINIIISDANLPTTPQPDAGDGGCAVSTPRVLSSAISCVLFVLAHGGELVRPGTRREGRQDGWGDAPSLVGPIANSSDKYIVDYFHFIRHIYSRLVLDRFWPSTYPVAVIDTT